MEEMEGTVLRPSLERMKMVRSEETGEMLTEPFLHVCKLILPVVGVLRSPKAEMDFLVELFRSLLDHPDWSMSRACTVSYNKALKKWHGWLMSSSFPVAVKIVPDRKKFMEIIGGSGDINADIETFCTTFAPILQENHKFLASVGLDDLKSS
ncbi:Glycolipid transfer protein 1 [Ananas comosus]|uniref:Glycolipid transfer protein 1 n=1 Tax=Ananas comosus TaxID=4615 RepID=A0A199US07_ANACO|nr:Glycolipid transfer protein 1 [Ananas comosus]